MSIEGTCDALPELGLEQAWRIKYTYIACFFTCLPELDRLEYPKMAKILSFGQILTPCIAAITVFVVGFELNQGGCIV